MSEFSLSVPATDSVSKEHSVRKRVYWTQDEEVSLIQLWEQKAPRLSVRQIQEKAFPDRPVSSLVTKISSLRYAGKVGHHYRGWDQSPETPATSRHIESLQVFLRTKEIIYSRFMVREIDGETVAGLKESIKLYGVLQPLVVFKNEYGQYEVICGNHRLCACKGIGLNEVPVIIKSSVTKSDAIFLSLGENVHRLEMNPIREGEIYVSLLNDYGYDVDTLVTKIGKSRYYIETRIKIFKGLHEELRGQIGKRLTIGNATALSGLPKDRQMEVYETLIQNIGPDAFFAVRAKGITEARKGANYRRDKPRVNYCICERCGARHLHGVSINDSNVA